MPHTRAPDSAFADACGNRPPRATRVRGSRHRRAGPAGVPTGPEEPFAGAIRGRARGAANGRFQHVCGQAAPGLRAAARGRRARARASRAAANGRFRNVCGQAAPGLRAAARGRRARARASRAAANGRFRNVCGQAAPGPSRGRARAACTRAGLTRRREWPLSKCVRTGRPWATPVRGRRHQRVGRGHTDRRSHSRGRADGRRAYGHEGGRGHEARANRAAANGPISGAAARPARRADARTDRRSSCSGRFGSG